MKRSLIRWDQARSSRHDLLTAVFFFSLSFSSLPKSDSLHGLVVPAPQHVSSSLHPSPASSNPFLLFRWWGFIFLVLIRLQSEPGTSEYPSPSTQHCIKNQLLQALLSWLRYPNNPRNLTDPQINPRTVLSLARVWLRNIHSRREKLQVLENLFDRRDLVSYFGVFSFETGRQSDGVWKRLTDLHNNQQHLK